MITRAKHLRHFPGELCPAGGKIEPGSNAIETAIRESDEEIGYTPTDPKKFGQVINPMANMVNLFYSKISDEELKNLKISRDECSSICLLPLKKLREYATEDVSIEIKFDGSKHAPILKDTDGFTAKTKLIKIKKSDLIVLHGEIPDEEVKFRPQGFFELERIVLSRINQPGFVIGQGIVEPCFNFSGKIRS